MSPNRLATVLALLLAAPSLAASPGTWTAKTAGSAGTASGTATGGAVRGAGATTAGAGTSVTMTVDSWSTTAEIDKLEELLKAGDTKAFLEALNGYDHGDVKIGSRSIPVDFAWTGTAGGKDVVVLISAKPFSASGSAGTASGAAVGYIRLTLDSSGAGQGAMYSTTQVGFQGSSGEMVARSGASTATALVEVAR